MTISRVRSQDLTMWFAASLALACTATGCANLPYHLNATGDTIVAIDIALEPGNIPARDSAPSANHLTLMRSFVRTSDLSSVAAVVADVLSSTSREDMTITETGVASPALLHLDARMAESLKAFAIDPREATDFIMTPDRSRMTGDTINAVERFASDASGINYRPLPAGSSGGAPFNVTGAAIYQIGRLGAPERTLWRWTGEYGARW